MYICFYGLNSRMLFVEKYRGGNMMKKRSLLFLSMLLVLSMFLAACGGKGNNAGSSKDGEKATQDLSINIKTEPPTLHPGLAEDSTSGTVLRQVLEGLTRINLEGKAELALRKMLKSLTIKKHIHSLFVIQNGQTVTL